MIANRGPGATYFRFTTPIHGHAALALGDDTITFMPFHGNTASRLYNDGLICTCKNRSLCHFQNPTLCDFIDRIVVAVLSLRFTLCG
jgi:hypothetical protein